MYSATCSIDVFYCKKSNPGRTNGPGTLMFLKFADIFKSKKLHTAYASNYNRLTGLNLFKDDQISLEFRLQ